LNLALVPRHEASDAQQRGVTFGRQSKIPVQPA
jgi:hypothetical protein